MIEMLRFLKCIFKPKRGTKVYIDGKRTRMFFCYDNVIETLTPIKKGREIEIEIDYGYKL